MARSLVPAYDVADWSEQLYPQLNVQLPRSAVYSNIEEYDPVFGKHVVNNAYAERVASIDPIYIIRFPAGTTLLGRDGYPVVLGNVLVKEQVAHWHIDQDSLDTLVSEPSRVSDIDDECLLLARYGEGTWGHWLGELVPRAVVAERRFPGRFKFVVPGWTMKTHTTFLQSLNAYGISADRLLLVWPEQDYRFKLLYTVSSVRSARAMHPMVIDLMRSAVTLLHRTFNGYLPSRLALLRKDVGRRSIANSDEIASLLSRRGFFTTELADLTFADQVSLFRGAHTLFCVLGSGLTNAIYSPDYISVVAPAPEAWGDDFFYPLIQVRNGRFADIRGPHVIQDEKTPRDSTFNVPIVTLQDVLDQLDIL